MPDPVPGTVRVVKVVGTGTDLKYELLPNIRPLGHSSREGGSPPTAELTYTFDDTLSIYDDDSVSRDVSPADAIRAGVSARRRQSLRAPAGRPDRRLDGQAGRIASRPLRRILPRAGRTGHQRRRVVPVLGNRDADPRVRLSAHRRVVAGFRQPNQILGGDEDGFAGEVQPRRFAEHDPVRRRRHGRRRRTGGQFRRLRRQSGHPPVAAVPGLHRRRFQSPRPALRHPHRQGPQPGTGRLWKRRRST